MTNLYFYFLGTLTLACILTAKAQAPAPDAPFPDERAKVSYSIGMKLAQSWREGQVDLDIDTVCRGVKDSMGAGATELTEKEMTDALIQFGHRLQVLQQQRRDQLAETNQLEGEAFLATNQKHAGVVALPSGLQYQVLAEGAGPSPDITNWVKLAYHGMKINGADIAGSAAQPQEGIFNLHGVIEGWTEALQMMKPGAKWRLFVPPSLAFGKMGSPEAGPNQTLIYDLELVSILPARPEPTPEEIKNELGPDGD